VNNVKASISMSLDGFIAGPNQSEEHPLGVGGTQLHEWKFSLKTFRESHGEEGGEVNASTPIAEEILAAGRAPTSEATHARDEPLGEPAPCCAFTVGDQGVPEHQLEPAQ
jgi:hypothetical protein